MDLEEIDKREKGALLQRLWKVVRYQHSTTNCGNCDFADSEWGGEGQFKGQCNLVKGLPFNIVRYGVCRSHSGFLHKE
jgi:hypothetical protein